MSTLLSGKETAAALTEKTKAAAEELHAKGKAPTLLIIRVGEKKSDISYEKGVRKRAQEAGIDVRVTALPDGTSAGSSEDGTGCGKPSDGNGQASAGSCKDAAPCTEDDLAAVIRGANADASVSGILLFLPLPKSIDEKKIINLIAPEKDMDGATDASMLAIYKGAGEGYAPCTAQAVLEILDFYNIDVTGKNIVVVGRSPVVGKPLALMLIKRNATVTVCHTRTVNLPEITRRADIIISAAGHPRTITAEHVREGQIVIDVGINFGPDGKMTGDAAFDEVSPIVSAITPVPGGVGSVTNAVLLSHIITAADR